MSAITIIWAMASAACLTLAAIHLLIWLRNRQARASLLYALTALSTAVFALFEMRLLLAPNTADYAATLRWIHVPIWLVLVTLVAFVRLYLRAGRAWLAWAVVGMRTLALLLNFSTGQSLNLVEVTALQRISFLGEMVAIGVGPPNPWMTVGQLSLLMFVVFVADASIAVWRRGDRRQAVLVGGSIFFFILASTLQTAFVFWAGVQLPFTFTLFSLGIVAAMGYELSHDVLRAADLVDELKASEVRLRESEARMTLAADSVGLGLWVWQLSPDQIWATPRCRAMLGFEANEPLRLADFLDRIHVDDRDATKRAIDSALRQRQPYEVHYRTVFADGSEHWIAASGRADYDLAGVARRMHGVCIDVTDRRRGEQETLRLRQEMAHVGRVSMMGQLASALAHEINQPLGAILRNAEAAAIFLAHPSPDLEEIRAIIEDIRQDDQRAGAVIERIRALLRRHTIDAVPLRVGDLFGDVAKLMRADAATRHIKLDMIDAPADLPPVRGDRVHLQQVMLNLIFNAMDAVANANPVDRLVSVTARPGRDRSVEIVVTDTGHGISSDNLARVFDPFFTTKSNGMGMGLSISRTLVEAHGGQLRVENSPDGGASFCFTLPTAGPEVEIQTDGNYKLAPKPATV